MINQDRISFFKACRRCEKIRERYVGYIVSNSIKSMSSGDRKMYRILRKQSKVFLKKKDLFNNTIFKRTSSYEK